jgi:hypothetical protein
MAKRFNKRRSTAYQFLKHRKLLVEGKGKFLVFDISAIPEGYDTKTFLKMWSENKAKNCYQIVNAK